MTNNTDQTIQLHDGRRLGYARYGNPDGVPVFYFTGGNSSRLEGLWFKEAARQYNIDLIVPDRPGFGLSDFQPGRQFLDWPEDVAQLADSLGIARFAVFGLSGGSPHVAAVSYKLPERVTRAAIVSGVAPPEMPNRFKGMWPPVRMIFFTARYLPALNRMALKGMGSFYADKEQMQKRMKQALPAPDVALIEARPEVIDIFSAAAREAHRNGLEGDAWEWRLYVHPWGFDLGEVQTEIGLWYGQFDQNAPVGMGYYLDEQFPNSHLTVVQDGGHFSTVNNHIGEIFEFLAKSR
jgi:pimeloyl-ACP methyl ester carboxylesterase